MYILNYFRRSSELPDPNGELASKLPSTAIVSSNKVVSEVQKRDRNVENITNIFLKYERKSEEWLALSVHTLQLCDTLSYCMGKNVRESTVRGIMKLYRELCARKRRLADKSELQ